MSNRILTFVTPLTLALAAVACDVAPAPVAPSSDAPLARATSTMIDLEADFLNPCTGETIHMTGRNKITTRIDDDGYHTNISFPDWHGVAPSGARYVYPGATNVVSHTSENGASTFTMIDRQRMIGSGPDGPANDFTLDVTYRYTINANGEVAVEIVSSETSCEE